MLVLWYPSTFVHCAESLVGHFTMELQGVGSGTSLVPLSRLLLLTCQVPLTSPLTLSSFLFPVSLAFLLSVWNLYSNHSFQFFVFCYHICNLQESPFLQHPVLAHGRNALRTLMTVSLVRLLLSRCLLSSFSSPMFDLTYVFLIRDFPQMLTHPLLPVHIEEWDTKTDSMTCEYVDPAGPFHFLLSWSRGKLLQSPAWRELPRQPVCVAERREKATGLTIKYLSVHLIAVVRAPPEYRSSASSPENKPLVFYQVGGCLAVWLLLK